MDVIYFTFHLFAHKTTSLQKPIPQTGTPKPYHIVTFIPYKCPPVSPKSRSGRLGTPNLHEKSRRIKKRNRSKGWLRPFRTKQSGTKSYVNRLHGYLNAMRNVAWVCDNLRIQITCMEYKFLILPQ
ncbi:hypothetical protein TNIN_273761 [Trichonephila inaurata madagascariensis]|uniref:Uncharacterized protein n=1 Tax=Trichonephila inaurata madagascariensis TaxID=2747483 RepID=A0A8X6YX02_9ARAC|nr:hypothetical protein TNIN_273761 [Trichonephila inaurata madagascariensis]